MISSNQLLGEIEQQIRLAKQATSESAQREAVYAVRALCNVLLADSPTIASAPTKPLQSVVSPQQPPISNTITSLKEEPMYEADANGESLFDF